VQKYRKAIEENPAAVSAYLNLSCACRALSQNDKALESLQKASELSPGNPDILSEEGWLCRHLGRAREAEDYFQDALKIQTDHLSALLGLGVSQLEGGNPSDAIEALQRL